MLRDAICAVSNGCRQLSSANSYDRTDRRPSGPSEPRVDRDAVHLKDGRSRVARALELDENREWIAGFEEVPKMCQ
jgi:hypothetical protein